MSTPQIAFIGAGNMASSIIGGLLEAGHPANAIRAADPAPQSLAKLAELGAIVTYSDNAAAIAGADSVILAVKPQVMAAVMDNIAPSVAASGAVVISIAAGITIDSMEQRLGKETAIIRCMPNTPALLGCGASGLFANKQTSDDQRAHAQFILSSVGITCWVDSEAELDAITALSGSGPAYFFLLTEAMIDAGITLGLTREVATRLATQTALGAARMATEDDAGLVELRRRVTSPGGTTERAVNSFEESGLRDMVSQAMSAAAERAVEMAREMG